MWGWNTLNNSLELINYKHLLQKNGKIKVNNSYSGQA